MIPKEHAVKFHELSDDSLADLLPVAKKVALALGVKDYNILQNNGMTSRQRHLILGRIAHQVVDHVHFHVYSRRFVQSLLDQIIPKPDQEKGLGVGWPAKEANMGELKALLEEIKGKL